MKECRFTNVFCNQQGLEFEGQRCDYEVFEEDNYKKIGDFLDGEITHRDEQLAEARRDIAALRREVDAYATADRRLRHRNASVQEIMPEYLKFTREQLGDYKGPTSKVVSREPNSVQNMIDAQDQGYLFFVPHGETENVYVPVYIMGPAEGCLPHEFPARMIIAVFGGLYTPKLTVLSPIRVYEKRFGTQAQSDGTPQWLFTLPTGKNMPKERLVMLKTMMQVTKSCVEQGDVPARSMLAYPRYFPDYLAAAKEADDANEENIRFEPAAIEATDEEDVIVMD